MKQENNFSKKFLTICAGIAIILCSASLFIFSINQSYANNPDIPRQDHSIMVQPERGTLENYIPLGIYEGNAYWVIFNTTDGYKFRKSPVSGSHWISKTE